MILKYDGCHMGFDVYRLISEHEKPGATVGYFAYLPKTGAGRRKIGTHRRDTIDGVKREIHQIFKEHGVVGMKKNVEGVIVKRYMGFDIYRIKTDDQKPQYIAVIPSIGTDKNRIGTNIRNSIGDVTREINLIVRQHDLCRNIIKAIENIKKRNLLWTPDKVTGVKCKAAKALFADKKTKAKSKPKKKVKKAVKKVKKVMVKQKRKYKALRQTKKKRCVRCKRRR